MTFFSKRKRKNDDPPRFPAWVMVLVALGLVIVAVILFQPSSRSVPAAPSVPQGDIELTATYIIQQATKLAQGTPQSNNDLDPFALTATYIVQQVTLTALGTPQPGIVSSSKDNLDPIEMTATYVVQQATEQASTPNS